MNEPENCAPPSGLRVLPAPIKDSSPQKSSTSDTTTTDDSAVTLTLRHEQILQQGKRIPLYGTALHHIRALSEDPTEDTIKGQLNHFRADIKLDKLTEFLRAIAASFGTELFGGEEWNDDWELVKKYVKKQQKRRWLGPIEEVKLVQGGLQALDISALRCLIHGLVGHEHPVYPLLEKICDRRNALKHSGDLQVVAVVSEVSGRDSFTQHFLSEFKRLFEVPESEMEEIPRKLDIHESCPFVYLQYQSYFKLAKSFIQDRNYSVAGQVLEKTVNEVRYEDGIRLMALLTLVLTSEMQIQGVSVHKVDVEPFVPNFDLHIFTFSGSDEPENWNDRRAALRKRVDRLDLYLEKIVQSKYFMQVSRRRFFEECRGLFEEPVSFPSFWWRMAACGTVIATDKEVGALYNSIVQTSVKLYPAMKNFRGGSIRHATIPPDPPNPKLSKIK